MKLSRLFSTSVIVAGASALALAQGAPALDVKLGLWELTMAVSMGGAAPAYDSSKMTAEQQAQMDSSMKQFMQPRTTVQKKCFTKEDLAKNLFQDQPGQTCKTTFGTNTRTVLDATRSCTGDQTQDQSVHLEATSTSTMKGTIKSVTKQANGDQTVAVALTGKWLATACGDIK